MMKLLDVNHATLCSMDIELNYPTIGKWMLKLYVEFKCMNVEYFRDRV